MGGGPGQGGNCDEDVDMEGMLLEVFEMFLNEVEIGLISGFRSQRIDSVVRSGRNR